MASSTPNWVRRAGCKAGGAAARREQGHGECKGLARLLDAAAKCSNLVVFSGSGLSATSGSSPQALCKAVAVAASGLERSCCDGACLLQHFLLSCQAIGPSNAGRDPECGAERCTALASRR